MKRWLLVATPAIVIAVLSTVFLLATDRDPEPLPPIASLPSPSPTTGPTGPTGPTEPTGQAEDPSLSGPTGSAGLEDRSELDEVVDPKEEEDDRGTEVSPPPPPPPPPDPGTVNLEVTASTRGGDPQVFTAPLGAKVVLEVTSTDVTDRIVVGNGNVSAKISPGRSKTLTFTVDEPGTVEVSLQAAKTVLAKISVGE